MKQELEAAITAVVQELFNTSLAVELTRPDEQFGDYSTNVALQLAGQLDQKPHEVAEQLSAKLQENLAHQVSQVTVAGPGFINLRLSDQALSLLANNQPAKSYVEQEVLTEFGDPNPFKEMHLGHLYTAIAGDAIARLFEASGATVQRLSYHGDVGMHVAKAIWAIRRHLQESNQSVADFFAGNDSIGRYYAEGNKAFEADEQAAEEIKQVNAHIYDRDDDQINQIYEAGKAVSFQNFDAVFDELGVRYVKRYLESESGVVGTEFVRAHTGDVFEDSDGAVIYRGEKAGLHTRVFINSRGLPTYEAKDLGLTELKNRDFPGATKSVIITAHEQSEYFKVMLAALAEFDADLAHKTQHLAHGFLSLSSGKMSSRSGQVLLATELLSAVQEAVRQQFPDSKVQRDAYLAAVKYSFLKHRIGGDIVFDVEESVALEGHSGPYLQYAHARARSILSKSTAQPADITELQPGERSLLRKISEYPEVVDKAVTELMPHHIAIYLYELAQVFNRFYEQNRVIGDEREGARLGLVQKYADSLQAGLDLLGIPAPEKM